MASRDSTDMNMTQVKPAGIDPEVLADLEAVLLHSVDGTPVESELAQRVKERSERLTEEMQEKFGEIDVDRLIHESRDEL